MHTKKVQNDFKNIINFSFLELLEIVCQKVEKSSKKTEIQSKSNAMASQIVNLAELLVQNVFGEHYIDYQWPPSYFNDLDENFDSELDAMKSFIERDVSIQNTFENHTNNQILWMCLEFIAQSRFFLFFIKIFIDKKKSLIKKTNRLFTNVLRLSEVFLLV